MGNGGPAAPHWHEVGPERVEAWLGEFTGRHGATVTTMDPSRAVAYVRAADGAMAECHVPFPPLPPGSGASPALIAEHALADRTVGVLLVRLGG